MRILLLIMLSSFFLSSAQLKTVPTEFPEGTLFFDTGYPKTLYLGETQGEVFATFTVPIVSEVAFDIKQKIESSITLENDVVTGFYLNNDTLIFSQLFGDLKSYYKWELFDNKNSSFITYSFQSNDNYYIFESNQMGANKISLYDKGDLNQISTIEYPFIPFSSKAISVDSAVVVGFNQSQTPNIITTVNNFKDIVLSNNVSLDNNPISGFLSVDYFDNILYCGTISDGVIRSLDFGKTWEFYENLGSQSLPPVRSICITDTISLIACEQSQLYISLDRGQNWELKNSGMPNNFRIFQAKSYQDLIFVCGSNQETNNGIIYYSSNFGESWEILLDNPNSIRSITELNRNELLIYSTKGDVWVLDIKTLSVERINSANLIDHSIYSDIYGKVLEKGNLPKYQPIFKVNYNHKGEVLGVEKKLLVK